MTIKEIKTDHFDIPAFYIFPEEYELCIIFGNGQVFVIDSITEYDQSLLSKIHFNKLPERIKQALQDPLFEIQCLKEIENYESKTDGIRESHYFDY